MSIASVPMAVAFVLAITAVGIPFAQADAADLGGKCTGTPSACEDTINTCASGCEGTAVVTPGVTPSVVCHGTPTACEAIKNSDACVRQGCQWQYDEGAHLGFARCFYLFAVLNLQGSFVRTEACMLACVAGPPSSAVPDMFVATMQTRTAPVASTAPARCRPRAMVSTLAAHTQPAGSATSPTRAAS